jgi:hypothetical protein
VQAVLPVLSRIAAVYLAIPATSAPSERLFSEAGVLLDRRRARMLGSRARSILFLNQNIHLMGSFLAAPKPPTTVSEWMRMGLPPSTPGETKT